MESVELREEACEKPLEGKEAVRWFCKVYSGVINRFHDRIDAVNEGGELCWSECSTIQVFICLFSSLTSQNHSLMQRSSMIPFTHSSNSPTISQIKQTRLQNNINNHYQIKLHAMNTFTSSGRLLLGRHSLPYMDSIFIDRSKNLALRRA